MITWEEYNLIFFPFFFFLYIVECEKRQEFSLALTLNNKTLFRKPIS
jgi:hypothetical protein